MQTRAVESSQKTVRDQFSIEDQRGLVILAKISETLRGQAAYHWNTAHQAVKDLALPINWESFPGNNYFDLPRLNPKDAENIASHMRKYNELVWASNDLIKHCAREFPVIDGQGKYTLTRYDLFDIAEDQWPQLRAK